MKKMYSGSITVFCGLVLPFVILFLLCLFYYGRHQTIESSIRRDSDAAGFSTLAEYDRTWVQEYGLYVVPKKQIEEDFRFYMEENRNHSWGNYAIEDLTITKINSLEDKAELQEQILMFMKERGLLEMIEEVGSTVLQIKELDQQVENEVNWKESDHLLRVQQLYGELVTLFEGVRSDGNKNLYSINYLLDEQPALSEVLEILKLEKLNSEQVGVLEQTYDELDHVARLCTEAQTVGAELEIVIDELETTMEELLAQDACFSLKQLAVNGRDLMALGLRGKEIGMELERLLSAVVDGNLPNQKEILIESIKVQLKGQNTE